MQAGAKAMPITSGELPGAERLRRTLSGELMLPSDIGFERSRRVWNGAVDKRPAAIAFCAGTGDVVSALSFARENEVPFSVRSGGHSIAGTSVCEGGLIID